MNKTKGFLLAAVAATFMFSCSDELKPIERETWEQREAANAQSSSSSGGNANLSSSGGVEISSSSSGAGISSGEEQKATISGVSQKGPFLNKTPVTLYELDNSLAQTPGNTFIGITDDKGSFSIEGELTSPYALLMAYGYYRNEVTGKESIAPIVLYAIADMKDRSSVNVNILTHLEYDRVLVLVKEQGKSLKEAKKQALREILAVFGIDGSNFKGSEDMSIFGESESDAALLAISILLQSNLSEGSFLALLADLSEKLKENGTWDNKAKKADMAIWASSTDLSEIEINILKWGLSTSVPNFKKYIDEYAAANLPTGDCEDSGNYFCYSGRLYEKCNGQNYNPDTEFCYMNKKYDKCGGIIEYNPSAEMCKDGLLGRECNGIWYNPSKKHCLDDKLYSCNEEPYNPVNQFCEDFKIYDKCGGSEYNPSTHSCYNDQTYSCGGKPYDPNTHSCYNNQTYSCGDKPYDPNTHSCHNDQTYSCGNKPYDPATHFCLGSTITQLCGGETFTSSQFCSANAIHNKCGGTVIFAPATEQCCGSGKYTIASQFCYNSSKVGSKCGTRTEIFDPDSYECKNSNKIYLKTKVKDSGNNEYDAVLIGTQTWMAKNLNYNVSDSKCYENNSTNCSTYGRLYTWSAAMNNASSSTAVPSGRQGICPAGWHIPSKAEWDMIITYLASANANAERKKLKATSGWNDGGNGTDAYGFLALPGGRSYMDNSFFDIGYVGYWWSASENSNGAYRCNLTHNDELIGWYNHNDPIMFSVRCVKN